MSDLGFCIDNNYINVWNLRLLKLPAGMHTTYRST